MKNGFIIVGLMASLSALGAGKPEIFIGKYEVEHSDNCDRDVGSRAYINLGTYSDDVKSVEIQFYGSDAVQVSVPYQSGEVAAPGSGGDLKETIKASWPNPRTLNTVVTSKSGRDKWETTYTLAISGQKLVVTTKDVREEVCTLVRKR